MFIRLFRHDLHRCFNAVFHLKESLKSEKYMFIRLFRHDLHRTYLHIRYLNLWALDVTE
jgi:hypothetical protein